MAIAKIINYGVLTLSLDIVFLEKSNIKKFIFGTLLNHQIHNFMNV
jgi:hypothetical protein